MIDVSSPERIPRRWRVWVGLLVSAGCVVWIVRALDWPQVAKTLSAAHYGLVGAAVLAVLLTIGARALRWAVLVRPLRPSWLNLLSALVIGQVANYALSRAGDLVRAHLLGGSESESRIQLLGTVAVEQIWDLLMVLLLIVSLSVWMDLPPWMTVVVPGVSLVALVGFGGAFVSHHWRNRLLAWMERVAATVPGRLGGSLSGQAARLFDGLGGLQRAGLAWRACVLSMLIWGLGAVSNWLILRAVGIRATSLMVLFLLVALRLGMTVPAGPGHVGFFEGLCMAVLGLWGVERRAAFSAGLILHTVVYLPPTLLALALGLTWGMPVRRLLRAVLSSGVLTGGER